MGLAILAVSATRPDQYSGRRLDIAIGLKLGSSAGQGGARRALCEALAAARAWAVLRYEQHVPFYLDRDGVRASERSRQAVGAGAALAVDRPRRTLCDARGHDAGASGVRGRRAGRGAVGASA